MTSNEIREALLEPLGVIIDSIRVTLERCPPELSSPISSTVGIVLTGGGALLKGIDQLISEETGLPVHVAEDRSAPWPKAPVSFSMSSIS